MAKFTQYKTYFIGDSAAKTVDSTKLITNLDEIF